MYEYQATTDKVVDSHILDVSIDLGFNTFLKQRISLSGISAPDTAIDEDKQKLLAAKQRLTDLLEQADDGVFILRTEVEKRGRIVGTIIIGGMNVNKTLIKEGLVQATIEEPKQTKRR